MDVTVLQRMLAEDAAAGRTPLVVIADVGTPIAGHVDNVPRLQELCKAHDAWLHLRGHGLASLILPFQHNGHVYCFYIFLLFKQKYNSLFFIAFLFCIFLSTYRVSSEI